LAFTRRIPGLKSETWGTLRVSKAELVWAPTQGPTANTHSKNSSERSFDSKPVDVHFVHDTEDLSHSWEETVSPLLDVRRQV